jgi:hypothetical protein
MYFNWNTQLCIINEMILGKPIHVVFIFYLDLHIPKTIHNAKNRHTKSPSRPGWKWVFGIHVYCVNPHMIWKQNCWFYQELTMAHVNDV